MWRSLCNVICFRFFLIHLTNSDRKNYTKKIKEPHHVGKYDPGPKCNWVNRFGTGAVWAHRQTEPRTRSERPTSSMSSYPHPIESCHVSVVAGCNHRQLTAPVLECLGVGVLSFGLYISYSRLSYTLLMFSFFVLVIPSINWIRKLDNNLIFLFCLVFPKNKTSS